MKDGTRMLHREYSNGAQIEFRPSIQGRQFQADRSRAHPGNAFYAIHDLAVQDLLLSKLPVITSWKLYPKNQRVGRIKAKVHVCNREESPSHESGSHPQP